LKDPEAVSAFCPTGEFHSMVYHELAMRATMAALGTGGKNEVSEPMVYAMAQVYFDEIRKSRDLGRDRTQCLLDLSHRYRVGGKERVFDIRQELRGNMKQYTLIVEEQAPYLREQIEQAMAKSDRWDRRRSLKQLSQDIARHSISVNAYNFSPEDIAERGEGDFWYLRPGCYDKDVGFVYQRKGWVIV
jgi:CRISPR-associated endonuclease/helicase Cas3